jgi:hypothetical protein
MKKSQSTDNLNIDELLNSNKAKATDIICGLLNYFSLIPTLVYNTAWFFYIKGLLENANDEQVAQCPHLYNWINYADTWVIISNIKALLLLGCTRICCGNENDINMLCLLVKSLTSLFVSFIFVINIPTHLYDSPDDDSVCSRIEIALGLFYKFEYTYVLSILLLFCLIPIGGCLVGLKEYIKSRSYKED